MREKKVKKVPEPLGPETTRASLSREGDAEEPFEVLELQESEGVHA